MPGLVPGAGVVSIPLGILNRLFDSEKERGREILRSILCAKKGG
jgi:hypothetical protein